MANSYIYQKQTIQNGFEQGRGKLEENKDLMYALYPSGQWSRLKEWESCAQE